MLTTLQWICLLLPWASLLFVRKTNVKRYMPVVIFTCLLMTIVYQMGYHYHWWTIHRYIVPWGYMNDVTFSYGIFAIGTFWIFMLTAHKLWLYLVTNLLVNAVFIFGLLNLLIKAGISSLDRIVPWQTYLLNVGVSLIIYGYHLWQQGTLVPPERKGKAEPTVRRPDWNKASREKAR